MARSIQLCAIAAAVVATQSFGFTKAVHAQGVPTTIPGILCDTQAQIRTIVSANQQSGDAMRTAYQALNMQLNSQDKPSCSVQDMPHTMLSVPNSVDVGPWPAEGQVLEAFMLHLQFDTVDGWFMYLAPGSFSSGSSNGI